MYVCLCVDCDPSHGQLGGGMYAYMCTCMYICVHLCAERDASHGQLIGGMYTYVCMYVFMHKYMCASACRLRQAR